LPEREIAASLSSGQASLEGQRTRENIMSTFATAQWKGGLKDGKGTLTTKSGVLRDTPYDFRMRFEGAPGTNPEELIGAAHAGCFTMALSAILGEAGMTAEQMDTRADLSVEKDGDGFAIKKIHLTLKAKIPGADRAKFLECAEKAKAGCPVSKLFKAEITLDAALA
jgi:osmotically inducible protein OsmC